MLQGRRAPHQPGALHSVCRKFKKKKRAPDTPDALFFRPIFYNKADDSYAAPIDRRAWKHSRQNTGRPCVGRKGTVVSLPHCEHVAFVSARIAEAPPPPPPPPSARLALHPLQRFGSFLKPLSAKNICSPPVNTNSAPHSEHFSTLSWYSMNHPP